jgi:hypothetical protein
MLTFIRGMANWAGDHIPFLIALMDDDQDTQPAIPYMYISFYK